MVGNINVIAIELPRANPNILAPILYSLNGILLLLHRKMGSYKRLSLIGQFVCHTTFWNNRSHLDGFPHVVEPEQVTGKDHRTTDPSRNHVGMLSDYHVNIRYFVNLASTLNQTGYRYRNPIRG